MKIVIAPDSFKESLTALQVARAIQEGFQHVFPDADYLQIPLADGGEGTVQAVIDAMGGKLVSLQVMGPLGKPVWASYGLCQATAVIEMAEASGLHLLAQEERNPLLTTTYGTGELIQDALNRGVKHVILGIGGSATHDGGAGMAQALGWEFFDKQGRRFPKGMGGGALMDLHKIDDSQKHDAMAQCQFEVACDVSNPLCGPKGAAAIFATQKGASAEVIPILDQALNHYADVLVQHGFSDLRQQSGAGAAGGLGFGAAIFLNAQLQSGFEVISRCLQLEEKIKGADLVLTGEGCIDGQTIYGKTPIGVAKLAQKQGIPTIAVAGVLGKDYQLVRQHGIHATFSITPRLMSLDQALQETYINLVNVATNIASVWKL